jgi:hypothetical protein
MTRAPAPSFDAEGNEIFDDRVVTPGAEETKTSAPEVETKTSAPEVETKTGSLSLADLMANPTQDGVRAARARPTRGFDRMPDDGGRRPAARLVQEAENTQHLNNYHDKMGESVALLQAETAQQFDETYRMPDEKYAHEYKESKTPILSKGERDGFASQPERQRNQLMDAKADEHAGHAKNFENEVSKTSFLDHPNVKEFGSNVLGGLALGYVGDKLTDKIMRQPTDKEWAGMSDEERMAYIHKREALGGAVTGGLGGLVSAASGSAAMFAPEVAIGTTAAMLGGAVSRGVGRLGGGEVLQAESGGVVGGAYAGGMSHAAGKAIKAWKNRGATEEAGEAETEMTEMGEGVAEEGEALGELGEVGEGVAEGAELAAEAAETAEAAATTAEGLAAGVEAAGEVAVLAGATEEGAGIGAFFAPETAGASIVIGAAAGAIISGLGLGIHKIFG